MKYNKINLFYVRIYKLEQFYDTKYNNFEFPIGYFVSKPLAVLINQYKAEWASALNTHFFDKNNIFPTPSNFSL